MFIIHFQLKDAALELYSLLKNMKSLFDTEDGGDSLLICQAPLEKFFSEEDKFQDAVANFTTILFAEVI